MDDLTRYFEQTYSISVPVLRPDDIVVDQRETQIDVRHDPMRMIMDTSRPVYIGGTEVEVDIPFDGEAEAFKIQPNPCTMGSPRVELQTNKLVLRIVGIDLNAERVKQEINHCVTHITSNLNSLRANVAGLNSQLGAEARSAIEARRQRLLASRSLVGSLGFKMKERPGAERTHAAKEVRRRITPTMPSASTAPYKPEPALSLDDYNHILTVLQNMVQVMELSPSAFHTMDEESLRSHFLVQLNGHYEGQATGETFNYQGKTDILVRSDGRNIFIAECKFWSGPKNLVETIDQLLSYSSWRDTKTAVILFNRNRDFSRVLTSIPSAVRSHSNYKRDLPGSSESSFRYCFAHRDDANRELLLTVLAFDVPTPRAK